MVRVLDWFASLFVAALGAVLLAAQVEDFFAGQPMDRPWARIFLFACSVSCLWFGFRAPFSPKERA